MKKIGLSYRFSCFLFQAISSFWLFLTFSHGIVPSHAQSLSSLFEELLKPNPGPQEELTLEQAKERAAERAKTAREKLELFQKRKLVAMEPSLATELERLQSELVSTSQEEVETWDAVLATLQELTNLENATLPSSPQQLPITEAALELEKKADWLQEMQLKLQVEIDSLRPLLERAKNRLRILRNEAEEIGIALSNESAEPQKQRLELMQELAAVRVRVAEANEFLLRWRIKRLEKQLTILNIEQSAIRSVLEQKEERRIFNSIRAQKEIETVRSLLADLQKKSEEASGRVREITETFQKQNAPSEAQKLELEIWNSIATARRACLATLRLREEFWQKISEAKEPHTLDFLIQIQRDLNDALNKVRALLASLDSRLSEAQVRTETLSERLRQTSITQVERKANLAFQQLNTTLTNELVDAKQVALQAQAFFVKANQELESLILELRSKQKVYALVRDVTTGVKNVLDYPLWQAGNKTLTLGLALAAIIGVFFSIYLSKFFSRRISVVIGRRFHIPQAQRHLYETLLLYALSLILALTILQWLEIPLTVFAFLGGALMVGIGFGSQNLINNFISGLLLLFEQNVKVGDLIEVGGRTGRVVQLGNRCMTIRTFDGVELLVPNSILLETTVVNWTLTDLNHRYEIAVGVAYGTDPELVLQTLRGIVSSHPEVLKEPAPEVFFENFGESSLDFRVFYWLHVGVHDARRVGSELRTQIVREFAKRGIEIPFPQRVLHLQNQSKEGKLSEPLPAGMGN